MDMITTKELLLSLEVASSAGAKGAEAEAAISGPPEATAISPGP